MEEHEVDFLILGGGAAGLSSALFAALMGYRVLLCEKTGQIGGTSASSAGIVWVPCNHLAQSAGIEDSLEKARTYLRGELGGQYRAEMLDAYLETAPLVFDFLQERTEVKFNLVDWPDYHSDCEGAAQQGRSLMARRFDGRRLKDNFRFVRPPFKSLMLLGGMHLDKDRVEDFLNPLRSVGTLVRVFRSLTRYARDRLYNERGTDVGGGNALVASLLYSLLDAGGKFWVNANPLKIISSEDGVHDAIISCEGKNVRVHTKMGIILATGGFPSSDKLRQELAPNFPHDITFGMDTSQGDGIALAKSVGGTIDTDVLSPAYWQPSSRKSNSDGSNTGVMYGYLDRGKPGVIAVDSNGKRFVNESNSYHDIGMAMFQSGLAQGNRFHFICDRTFIWHHGLGMILPYRLSLRKYVKSGYIKVAPTIEELAQQIAVEPQALANTVARHNNYALDGRDPDFNRGETNYNRLFGCDRANGPNKNLAPIEKSPFIALEMHPGTLGTAIGVSVTPDAQVCDREGKPIHGLYAVGNDMTALMRGAYPGGGITIGPAIVFAYRAVERAIRSSHGAAANRSETLKRIQQRGATNASVD